ncbi:hypothetical protein PanWU01x14_247950, partial [Parasponia andersonii]
VMVTNLVEVPVKNSFSLLVNTIGINNDVEPEKGKKKLSRSIDDVSETNRLSHNPQVMGDPDVSKNSTNSPPGKINVNISFQEVSDDSSGMGATSKRTRSLTPMLPPRIAQRLVSK